MRRLWRRSRRASGMPSAIPRGKDDFMKGKALLILLTLAALAAGCATSRSGDVYSRGEALREQTVRLATVESVRPVTIEGTRSGIGAAAGGIAGGVAGSGVGGGRGAAIAGVLGAVGGGVAGQAIEEGATRRRGV